MSESPDPHPCVVGRTANGFLEYDHEWVLKHDSDDVRQYDWLECENCGAQKEATYADLGGYEDDY